MGLKTHSMTFSVVREDGAAFAAVWEYTQFEHDGVKAKPNPGTITAFGGGSEIELQPVGKGRYVDPAFGQVYTSSDPAAP